MIKIMLLLMQTSSRMSSFLFMILALASCARMLAFQFDRIQKNACNLRINISRLLFSQQERTGLRTQLLTILIQLVSWSSIDTSVNIRVSLVDLSTRMMMKIHQYSLSKTSTSLLVEVLLHLTTFWSLTITSTHSLSTLKTEFQSITSWETKPTQLWSKCADTWTISKISRTSGLRTKIIISFNSYMILLLKNGSIITTATWLLQIRMNRTSMLTGWQHIITRIMTRKRSQAPSKQSKSINVPSFHQS